MKIIFTVICLLAIFGALFVGELWTQIFRYRAYWNKVSYQPVPSGNLVYAALGDSAAQGVGATKPEKGYVGLVAKDLGKSSGKKVSIINLSKSGANVADVLDKQLPQLYDFGPKSDWVITLDIGANDMTDYKEQKFTSQMDQLMSHLPKQTLIADIPSFRGSRLAKHEPSVEAANAVMRKLAQKHGFVLVPLHDRIAANNGWRTYAADWFHPSNYAYRNNWAPVFIDRLHFSQSTP